MENQVIKAKSKYVRQSPYKVRLVLNLIRGLEVNEALNILSFTKRKAAEEIKQVLESAIANAETNLGLNSSNLFISNNFLEIFQKLYGKFHYSILSSLE